MHRKVMDYYIRVRISMYVRIDVYKLRTQCTERTDFRCDCLDHDLLLASLASLVGAVTP